MMCAFTVLSDFSNPKQQAADWVYVPSASATVNGGHAVVVFGWGVTAGGERGANDPYTPSDPTLRSCSFCCFGLWLLLLLLLTAP